MARKNEKSSDERDGPPTWEWLLAGVGAVLIAGVMAAMVYRAFADEGRPPGFELNVVSVVQSGDGYVATFRIKNLGSQTAANVGVEGIIGQGTEAAETSAATISYVPGNSEREGGLFFKKDPRQLELRLRAVGYEKP
jgi:uncharacterized protein (TIGR02588 family)